MAVQCQFNSENKGENMRYTVSATTRDCSPEATEIPWTRQTVADQQTAERICIARNRAELAVNGSMIWGYYVTDESSTTETEG